MKNINTRNRIDFNLNGSISELYRAVSSIVGDRVFNSAGKQLGKISDVILNIADKKIESIVLQLSGLIDPTRSFRKVAFDALSLHPAHVFILNKERII